MSFLLAGLLATATVQGTLKEAGSRAGVARADISISGLRLTAMSDVVGRFTIPGVRAGRWQLRVIAIGYAPYETTIQVPDSGTVRLDIELTPRVSSLPAVDVRAPRLASDSANEGQTADALFERETTPGVTAMSRREIRGLPTIIEPDVLRALQAMPGVVPMNEFDAQLYVRGGAPDQNTFLLDGARIFSPYHLFGMTGAFNPDAVEGIEFFRGSMPARFGGVLSSVVSVAQRDGGDESAVEGGLSILGARATARGTMAGHRGTWMVAGRRSHADLILGAQMPYAFYDGHARATFSPSATQRFTASAFTSADRFRMFFGGGDETLFSRWTNQAASVQWQWTPPSSAWSATSTLWGSRYHGSLGAGGGVGVPVTRSDVDVGGLRVEAIRRAAAGSLRIGAEVERGAVVLDGTSLTGGYFVGRAQRDYVTPAIYAEADWNVGRLRLAPGLRLTTDPRSNGLLVEPRISARAQLTDALTFTVAAGRAHQSMSELRDERTVIPGAPLWFVHPVGAPLSRSDGLSTALDLRLGRGWTIGAEAYARRFADAPHWRPMGIRDLTSISYDDGRANGLEVTARRYGNRISGWLGAGIGRTQFTEAQTGRAYDAPWDRQRFATGGLLMGLTSRIHVSARLDYGTGHPFWPFAGDVATARFEPLLGGTDVTRLTPVWSDRQLRLPDYARFDLGVRSEYRLWGAIVEPYINFQNLFGRPNVIHYQLKTSFLKPDGTYDPNFPGTTRLHPIAAPKISIPTIGFNVRF